MPAFVECVVEHVAGGPDERVALLVFLVARHLAHQHERRVRRTFTEHDLRCVLPQRTRPALRCFGAQLRQ